MVTDREMASEVMRRVGWVRQGLGARRKIAITSAVAACLLVIVGVSAMLPSAVPEAGENPLLHSASLMGAGTAGGYVLVGVLAFMLGTLVSWFALKGNQAARRRDDDDDA